MLVGTRRADDAGGLNGVVAVGTLTLLFLWRGCPDGPPRARPEPRFDLA